MDLLADDGTIRFRRGCPHTGWLANDFRSAVVVPPHDYGSVEGYFRALEAAGMAVTAESYAVALQAKFSVQWLALRLLGTGVRRLVDDEDESNRTGRVLEQLRTVLGEQYPWGLWIDADSFAEAPSLLRLKEILQAFPGCRQVFLDIVRPEDFTVSLRLPVRVCGSAPLIHLVRNTFGNAVNPQRAA